MIYNYGTTNSKNKDLQTRKPKLSTPLKRKYKLKAYTAINIGTRNTKYFTKYKKKFSHTHTYCYALELVFSFCV